MNMIPFTSYKILFLGIGVALLIAGGYVYFRQWSHVNLKTRAYTYFNKKEQGRRSLKAGFAGMIFTFGVWVIIGVTFFKPTNVQNTLVFLALGACLSPLVMLTTIFRMHRELEPYTKNEDDVVFLDEGNNTK